MKNQLLLGDNLEIMREMESESVDLIATDPPFNSGIDYGEFTDKWEWNRESDLAYYHAWINSDSVQVTKTMQGLFGFLGESSRMAYLIFMCLRLSEMHRLLKSTGSLYLHCDQSASHHLKIILDAIFGTDQFRNEIIWAYDYGGRSKKMWPRKNDRILFYTKSDTYVFNYDDIDRIPYTSYMCKSLDKLKKGKVPTDVWWNTIVPTNSKERTGYPTQKPTKLYDRVITASSNVSDIILDPFCGSGTTLVSAHNLGRYYIGIDQNATAIQETTDRLSQMNLFAVTGESP